MAANVQFVVDADTAKAVNGFLKIVDTQKETEHGFKKIDRAADRSIKNMARGFGQRATSGLKSYAVGLLGVAAAANAATAAVRDMARERNQAGQRITNSIEGRRALIQIAGNQAEFEELKDFAKGLRTKHGYGEVEAYRATFQAGSAGERFLTPQSMKLLGELRRMNISPTEGISSAQKLQSGFGGTGAGEAGAGNFRQIMNKLLAAAGKSPEKVGAIASSASTASVSWANIGGTDEELLAMGAVLSKPFKTPEAGFERIKSLSSQLVRKRSRINFKGEALEGLELVQALPRLAREGRLLSEGGEPMKLSKFVGEANAMEAVSALGKLDKQVAERLKIVEKAERLTGTDRSPLARRRLIGDKEMRAVMMSQREIERLQQVQESRFGVANKAADAVDAHLQRRYIQQGYGPWTRYASRKLLGATRYVVGDEFYAEQMSRGASPEMQRGVDQLIDEGSDAAANMTREAANKMGDAADKLTVAAEKMINAGPKLDASAHIE